MVNFGILKELERSMHIVASSIEKTKAWKPKEKDLNLKNKHHLTHEPDHNKYVIPGIIIASKSYYNIILINLFYFQIYIFFYKNINNSNAKF